MTETTASFTVIAEFLIKPGERDAFLALAHEDARQSLAHETGCHQFDVLISENEPNQVVLHECYTDRAAFEAHKGMPHYAPFKDGSAPLLADTPLVRTFTAAD